MSDAEMIVATAENLADSNGGMRFGPATSISASLAARSDPSTGDFNADGLTDVAWIGADYTVHFATVCPGDVGSTICSGKTALQVLLDPDHSQADPIRNCPITLSIRRAGVH